MQRVMPDVNVLVLLHREEMRGHQSARLWFDNCFERAEIIVLTEFVCTSFVRLVTNKRIFNESTSSSDALKFVSDIQKLTGESTSLFVASHWQTFELLCQQVGLTGNDIPDTYLAAVAIDLEATLVIFDKGFQRFPGLNLQLLQTS